VSREDVKVAIDAATRLLAGCTIWNVAEWLYQHDDGEPYEMWRNGDGSGFGYRLTVERIPPKVT
jgi:hypothetical protein